MKKKILLGALALIAVIVVVVFVFSERLVRAGIEAGGTKALGVETTVDDVHLALFRGRVGLEGLRIANPEGYESPALFTLGEGRVAVKILSLLGDPVEVQEIQITAPQMTLERQGLKTNVFSVLKNLKSKKQGPGKAEKEGKDESGKSFRIGRIRISDPKVHVRLAEGVNPSIALPTIELNEISNADGTPVMLADVFEQVLLAMARSSLEHGKGVIPDDFLGALGDQLASLKSIGGKLREIGSDVTGTIEKAVGEGVGQVEDAARKGLEKGTESAKKAAEGLKGLLPGKKNEK